MEPALKRETAAIKKVRQEEEKQFAARSSPSSSGQRKGKGKGKGKSSTPRINVSDVEHVPASPSSPISAAPSNAAVPRVSSAAPAPAAATANNDEHPVNDNSAPVDDNAPPSDFGETLASQHHVVPTESQIGAHACEENIARLHNEIRNFNLSPEEEQERLNKIATQSSQLEVHRKQQKIDDENRKKK